MFHFSRKTSYTSM